MESPAERSRQLERFLTFLDAIVAIAITLLVLPLVEVSRDLEHYSSVHALIDDNVDSIWAFLLSFFVVARYWLAQHHTMARVVQEDRRVTQLLLVWAVSIVFLPFPTALVAEDGSDPTVKVIYLGTAIATTLAMSLVAWRLRRHPELTDGGADVDPVDGLSMAALLAVALVVMLVFPGVSYFPMFLLLLGNNVADLWRRLRRRPVSGRAA